MQEMPVQTLLWPLGFVIQINLEHDTIAVKKLNISLVSIKQLCFKVPKDVRLSPMHYLVWKFQVKDSSNKLQLIIRLILTLKILLRFVKNAQ